MTFSANFCLCIFFSLLLDCWSSDSQSRLLDTPLVAKDGPEKRPQAHTERCHSQCRVWGPSQQVHPASPGGRSWGEPQQVQVSRINSLQWSVEELSSCGTEWAEKRNRPSIHVTEPRRRINDPFTSQRIQLKKNRLIQSLNNSTRTSLFAYISKPESTALTSTLAFRCILNRIYVSTSDHCRSASTTPSGSPCSSQQSVYHPGEADALSALAAPTTQPSWNPFGDDNFSKLTAEELLNKDFAKLAESKCNFIAVYLQHCEIVVWSKMNCNVAVCLCTDAAPGEKVTGSSENLIPGLIAFPGKSLPSYSHYAVPCLCVPLPGGFSLSH